MITIMDGKEVSKKMREVLRKVISTRGIQPKLVVVQMGNDKASSIYVRNKSKACEEIGIKFEDIHIPETNTWEQVLSVIDQLNENPDIDGILIQQPVPEHLKGIEQFINSDKDVDGFKYTSLGKLVRNDEGFVPCTTLGILDLLDYYRISVEGKHIVIVGRSNIVGKPTMLEMLNRDATVTICHSKTKNLSQITKTADILVVAVGKPCFINNSYIGNNTNVVIDVGINRLETGDIVGDCNMSSIIERWEYLEKNEINKENKFITPVPGGIGPMTVAELLHNMVISSIK